MDNAEQILKSHIAELLWQNAILTAEFNKLKKQLEEKEKPADA